MSRAPPFEHRCESANALERLSGVLVPGSAPHTGGREGRSATSPPSPHRHQTSTEKAQKCRSGTPPSTYSPAGESPHSTRKHCENAPLHFCAFLSARVYIIACANYCAVSCTWSRGGRTHEHVRTEGEARAGGAWKFAFPKMAPKMDDLTTIASNAICDDCFFFSLFLLQIAHRRWKMSPIRPDLHNGQSSMCADFRAGSTMTLFSQKLFFGTKWVKFTFKITGLEMSKIYEKIFL